MYVTHSNAQETPVPPGGWYGDVTDETTPIGDYLITNGPVDFVSLSAIRRNHTQSMVIDGNQDFHLLTTEDTRPARKVLDLKIISASVSVPIGITTWTQSFIAGQGTGSVFFPTSSTWNVGDIVTASFSSEDPDNRYSDVWTGFRNATTFLARNSMSLADASGYTLIPNTYFIASLADRQIVGLGTNLCNYINGGNVAIDPHNNPTGSALLTRVDCYVNPVLSYVSAVKTVNQTIEWLVSDDGPGAGWANPVTTSATLTSHVRSYWTGSPLIPDFSTMSLFDPVSTVLNGIRNYGVAVGNDVTTLASLKMTSFGCNIVTSQLVNVDYPLASGRYQDVSGDGNPYFWLDYNSGSTSTWFSTRTQRLGFYAGSLSDSGDGWPSPGNVRAGEFTTPRIRRAHSVERSFHHDPSQSCVVISGSTAYDTTENARILYPAYEVNGGSGSFLDFTSDWRYIIASNTVYDMKDIAIVGHFNTSADKYAAYNAWKNKLIVQTLGGPISYAVGSARESTYLPNNLSQLINGGTSGDDNGIRPQVLALTTEHINAAASAVNHTGGTRIKNSTWRPSVTIILDQYFPPQAIGKGFTYMQRQYGVGYISNIRPRNCAAMWDKSLYPDMATSLSADFGITPYTSADFPDQTDFALASNLTTVSKLHIVDGSGTLLTTDYSDPPTNTSSQSIWANTGSVYAGTSLGGLFPLPFDASEKGLMNGPIHPQDVHWLTFDQMDTISKAKIGRPFYYEELVLPLKFGCVLSPTLTTQATDNSGFFGGDSFEYASLISFYNDPDGQWIAGGNDGMDSEISGGFDGLYALRADTSPIREIQTLFGGVGGNMATLVKKDYGRLIEKLDKSIGGYMPAISEYPYTTVGSTQFNGQHDVWGNNSYLFLSYGVPSGTYRGAALIWPRNFADWTRNHITTVEEFARSSVYDNFPALDSWFNIPRSINNGVEGPPRLINFTEAETIINASDIAFAQMEIVQTYHDFSQD